jgi:hypothetical protein
MSELDCLACGLPWPSARGNLRLGVIFVAHIEGFIVFEGLSVRTWISSIGQGLTGDAFN